MTTSREWALSSLRRVSLIAKTSKARRRSARTAATGKLTTTQASRNTCKTRIRSTGVWAITISGPRPPTVRTTARIAVISTPSAAPSGPNWKTTRSSGAKTRNGRPERVWVNTPTTTTAKRPNDSAERWKGLNVDRLSRPGSVSVKITGAPII